MQYAVVKMWADHKKLPKINDWWYIEGDNKPVKKIRVPSKAKLKHYDAIFRSLGRKKHG